MPFKIRVGFITNKAHDPILPGQQDRDYPEKFKIKNNTSKNPEAAGWGGPFQIDTSVGLRLGKLNPDIFHIDLMMPKDVSLARLQNNHLNFNLGHDYIDAHCQGAKHAAKIKKALMPTSNNMYPEWPVQNWIYRKDIYFHALEKAKIPTIPTIVVEGKFDAKDVVKKVKAKGWEKFFIKPGDFGAYGGGVWNGSTKDCMDSLLKYQKEESPHYNVFLVQPYMLKPNGKVFDEVRNFFLGGEWAYSVYTDGTNDDDVWTQPPGPVKEATKALAHRAYAEWNKVTKWRGQKVFPALCRIDIGIIPDKNAKGGVRTFVNEIEQECTTFLVRYCPFNLLDRLGVIYTETSLELLRGRLASGEKVADREKVEKLLDVLDERVKSKTWGKFVRPVSGGKRKVVDGKRGDEGKPAQKKHRTA